MSYIPNEVPKNKEIVYFKAIRDPIEINTEGEVPKEFVIDSVTWADKYSLTASKHDNIIILENNRHMVNFDVRCFIQITEDEYYKKLNRNRTKLLLI